jgi:hypothetical protein
MGYLCEQKGWRLIPDQHQDRVITVGQTVVLTADHLVDLPADLIAESSLLSFRGDVLMVCTVGRVRMRLTGSRILGVSLAFLQ